MILYQKAQAGKVLKRAGDYAMELFEHTFKKPKSTVKPKDNLKLLDEVYTHVDSDNWASKFNPDIDQYDANYFNKEAKDYVNNFLDEGLGINKSGFKLRVEPHLYNDGDLNMNIYTKNPKEHIGEMNFKKYNDAFVRVGNFPYGNVDDVTFKKLEGSGISGEVSAAFNDYLKSEGFRFSSNPMKDHSKEGLAWWNKMTDKGLAEKLSDENLFILRGAIPAGAVTTYDALSSGE